MLFQKFLMGWESVEVYGAKEKGRKRHFSLEFRTTYVCNVLLVILHISSEIRCL
jgi:hypothetical protein